MCPLTIRPLLPNDTEAAALVFFDAVHYGTVNEYSLHQRRAWAGEQPNPDAWCGKFDGITGYVVEIEENLVGFMTIDLSGYIDLAFVQAEMSGRGIGRMLYEHIESLAISRKMPRMTTQASKKAKPFFEKFGWDVICEQ